MCDDPSPPHILPTSHLPAPRTFRSTHPTSRPKDGCALRLSGWPHVVPDHRVARPDLPGPLTRILLRVRSLPLSCAQRRGHHVQARSCRSHCGRVGLADGASSARLSFLFLFATFTLAPHSWHRPLYAARTPRPLASGMGWLASGDIYCMPVCFTLLSHRTRIHCSPLLKVQVQGAGTNNNPTPDAGDAVTSHFLSRSNTDFQAMLCHADMDTV